jgi:hypothetical protein
MVAVAAYEIWWSDGHMQKKDAETLARAALAAALRITIEEPE